MACSSRRREEIGDFAAGRLALDAVDDFLAHLETCAACSAELDLVADLVSLHARPPAAPVARRRGGRPVLIAAVAAIAAGLAIVAWLVVGSRDAARRSSLLALANTTPLPVASWVPRAGAPTALGPAYEEAMARYARGDWEEAARRLSSVADAAPEAALPRLYLGIAEIQLGRSREAIAPLEEAARLGEDLLRERALWTLANAHLVLDDAHAALAVLERLRELRGDYEPNARDAIDAIHRVRDE